MEGGEEGGAEQEAGDKAITNTSAQKEKILFFQRVNSVAPARFPVLAARARRTQ